MGAEKLCIEEWLGWNIFLENKFRVQVVWIGWTNGLPEIGWSACRVAAVAEHGVIRVAEERKTRGSSVDAQRVGSKDVECSTTDSSARVHERVSTMHKSFS